MGALTVEEIATEEALARIAPEWRALSERAEGALLFNTFEWVSACWKHLRAPGRLWVLAVRDAGSLRAIVPLWIETRRLLGLRTRIARFLGEGPSDYGDLLLTPPRSAVLDAAVAYLASCGAAWDLIELREFFGESASLQALIGSMKAHGWWTQRAQDSRCETIATAGGWEAYYQRRISGKRRKDLRREWRNLEATGAVTNEIVVQVPRLDELAASFAEIQAAHVAAGEHRPGEFNDAVLRPFLESILAMASANGWLRLALMRVDGLPVAYWVAFLYRGRYYVYNTAHRADSQRLGAGKLLMIHMLERFFAEGGAVIDYLRGAEAYKGVWTEDAVVNCRLRAARPGIRALAGRLLWFDLLPWAQARAPRLHRLLTILSEEGARGIAARLLRRLRRARP